MRNELKVIKFLIQSMKNKTIIRIPIKYKILSVYMNSSHGIRDENIGYKIKMIIREFG